MKKVCFLLCLAVTAMLAGCVFTAHKQHQTHTYDLNLPIKPQTQNVFVVTAFANDTPSRSRMLYRQTDNSIVQDPYNSWIQSPERLLQRHYMLAFPLQGNVKTSELAELRCSVTAFEFDLQKSEAHLVFNYTLRKDEQRFAGTICAMEKISNPSSQACAEAMSKAAAQAAGKLWQEVKKFTAKK